MERSPDLQRAILRAVAAYRRGKLAVLGARVEGTSLVFEVSSGSEPEISYLLGYVEGKLVCGCPAGVHGLMCYHIGLLVHLGWPYEWPRAGEVIITPEATMEPPPGISVVEEAVDLLIALQQRDGELGGETA